MKKFEEAHLEIISNRASANIRIRGSETDIIFAWMVLTSRIAEKLKVPVPEMLALCAALHGDVENLNRSAETCEIDMSHFAK